MPRHPDFLNQIYHQGKQVSPTIDTRRNKISVVVAISP